MFSPPGGEDDGSFPDLLMRVSSGQVRPENPLFCIRSIPVDPPYRDLGQLSPSLRQVGAGRLCHLRGRASSIREHIHPGLGAVQNCISIFSLHSPGACIRTRLGFLFA